jgi:hypothetical protein
MQIQSKRCEHGFPHEDIILRLALSIGPFDTTRAEGRSQLYSATLSKLSSLIRRLPQRQPIYSRNIQVPQARKETAVVVQWSAHPIWYPKLLSALPTRFT